MKRICELAGINYELEKQSWWAKYHQQKTNEIKAGTPIDIVPWWRTLKTSSQSNCSLFASMDYRILEGAML